MGKLWRSWDSLREKELPVFRKKRRAAGLVLRVHKSMNHILPVIRFGRASFSYERRNWKKMIIAKGLRLLTASGVPH